MPARRFFWRLFSAYLLLLCVGIAVIDFFASYHLHTVRYEDEKRVLLETNRVVYALLREDLRAGRIADIRQKLAALEPVNHARITIIDSLGKVLADTSADPEQMENHLTRPEIVMAASQGEGESIRKSHTLDIELLYLATCEHLDGRNIIVRLAVPLAQVQAGQNRSDHEILLATALALLLGGLLCFGLAHRQAQPVAELSRFAGSLAQNGVAQRIHISEDGELGALDRALNQLAEALAEARAQAGERQEDLLALLASMSDGVVATSQGQRILLTNPAAAEMLGFSAEAAPGKPLWESVRVEAILKAAPKVLASGQKEIVRWEPQRGRHLEAALSPLLHKDQPTGLLIVIRNTTKDVQYQDLRKEFVANVSHELRTPLTFIKGFIETLMDGAMHDPVKGPEYLATASKHINQLTNLVNDLLELSQLEGRPGLPRRAMISLPETIGKVVDLIQPAIKKKEHTLSVQAPPGLPSFSGDPDYIERAIFNLIDNAIKYTPAHGQINVSVRFDGSRLILAVKDNGIGIPAADLPRIFERFYRVDKSRSRDMGGTGLGLAIVKHVAMVHGGTIEVSSTPGQGCTFILSLPLKNVDNA
jgi:two-component system phosphate regulon sensor histidine kinase PhoR